MDNDHSTLNENAIREHLEERLRTGRDVSEAAGEILFVRDKQVSSGVLSIETRADYANIVDEWLSEKCSSDSLTPHQVIAVQYARFLSDKVDWALLHDVPAQIDEAWRQWRARAT